MHISGNAQKILKTLHLLAVSFWIGGCLALFILLNASGYAQSDGELYGMLRSFQYVNVYVVVYGGALGSFFTGLAYSICTNRGFFRHKWIIIKWALTLYLMLTGTLLLGPWSTYLLETARKTGLAALADPEYARVASLHWTLQVAELGLFVAATVISVYKPWEIQETISRLRKGKK
jgi:putative copper export protein